MSHQLPRFRFFDSSAGAPVALSTPAEVNPPFALLALESAELDEELALVDEFGVDEGSDKMSVIGVAVGSAAAEFDAIFAAVKSVDRSWNLFEIENEPRFYILNQD